MNLLTKEKAKLQVHIEEVSTTTFTRPYPLIPNQNICVTSVVRCVVRM